VFASK